MRNFIYIVLNPQSPQMKTYKIKKQYLVYLTISFLLGFLLLIYVSLGWIFQKGQNLRLQSDIIQLQRTALMPLIQNKEELKAETKLDLQENSLESKENIEKTEVIEIHAEKSNYLFENVEETGNVKPFPIENDKNWKDLNELFSFFTLKNKDQSETIEIKIIEKFRVDDLKLKVKLSISSVKPQLINPLSGYIIYAWVSGEKIQFIPPSMSFKDHKFVYNFAMGQYYSVKRLKFVDLNLENSIQNKGNHSLYAFGFDMQGNMHYKMSFDLTGI